ncbi:MULTISPECIES: EF-hand domain-containing protein [unclassified Pseudodesulfovibrio]|uniref:EF-hand domain-containing protein n=1 Tax=unclassified Pseudodesulfovibrio TaxID=2661612 RepID=UPI0013E3DC14|nr:MULTISPECIES: EF-hand domain-containing protein [unclassified Pseudodesulfovibrio]MCJ2164539.1 EF-hand domain-containing protein [Pseudodesulfovibrio sp. S3-i]
MEIGSVSSMTGMMGMQGGMMQGMEKPDASEASSDFIDAMDSDGDGLLSESEFAVGDGETQSTEAFDALDTNEDGFVSQEELEADMESRLGKMADQLSSGSMFSGIESGDSDQFQQLLNMVGSGSGQTQAGGAEAYGQMQEGTFDFGSLGADVSSSGLSVSA